MGKTLRHDIGLLIVLAGAEHAFLCVSQKVQKSLEFALTVLVGGVYNPLTNDGGDAAGEQEGCP